MRKGEVTVRGATLAAFRKKSGLTQAALAAIATKALQGATGDPEASVSESLIALIETNRRQPSRLNAEAIAQALDVDFDALAIDNYLPAEAAS